MKKLITLTVSLIICLLPCFSSAAYHETSCETFIYDDERGWFLDAETFYPLDLSIVPEDIKIYPETIGQVEEADDELIDSYIEMDVTGAVCELGGIYYSSITDAFGTFEEESGIYQIFLLDDCYYDSSLKVPSGCHVTVIMNESDLIGESNYAFIVSGDLDFIGAGTISNSLGGGIYNLGSGCVRLQNCVSIYTKEICLVNNKDGSIYVSDNCVLTSEISKTKKQISYGAGSIVDNSEVTIEIEKTVPEVTEDIEEVPPKEEEKKSNLFSLFPLKLTTGSPSLRSDNQLDSLLDSSTSVISKTAHLLMSPPWIYIIGFVLLGVIVLIIKNSFLK